MSNYDPISRVSEPRKRRSVFVRIFGRWLAWGVIVSVAAFVLASWAYITFSAPGPLAEKKIIQFSKPIDHGLVATTLQEQGIITNALVFSVAARMSEVRGARIKPGEYEFNKNQSMEEILSMFTRGNFLTYKVTIPEGWTSYMVVNRLNEQDFLDGTIANTPPEGSLLPETYIVARGYPREKLLADMAAAQTKFLELQFPRLTLDSPIKTKAELLTLASIVEKETGVAEERNLVAAVFLNRLNQNMRLQSDPTVIYGVAPGIGKLDHPLTRTELITPTPYNTYTNAGLPPGPIANPGKAAIEAVLMPAINNNLYFVADGTGGHAFAETLEQHNANVKKWRALTGQTEQTAPESVVEAEKDPSIAKPEALVVPATVAKAKVVAKATKGKKVPVPRLKKTQQ